MFFTLEKISKQLPEIRAAMHRQALDIPAFKYIEGNPAGAHLPGFDDRKWVDFRVGEPWGGYDKTAWFRARLSIPAGWQDEKLHLRFLVGPRDDGNSTAETLLYVNGIPLQGIDVFHDEAWIPAEYTQAGEIAIALKAWSGVLQVPKQRRFKLAQLIQIDRAAECLYFVTDTLLKAIQVMDENDLRRVHLLQAVNQAFLSIDFSQPGSDCFYRSLGESGEFLMDQVLRMGALEELKPAVTAVGHAHIDLAWLWRLDHSREKAARTFATALHMMRQYPEYHYLHSSPQLYKYLKSDYPQLYDQVKEKIAAGKWEITGATWVEPDVNLPGGESLVRQFLFANRFVRQEFGVKMNVLWLPDVFGYSWALPQIIRDSGIRYFMTTKISWSQFNRFPYDTFYWRGIDGTQVLTYFVTTPDDNNSFYTYNGQLRPAEIKGIWDAYQQKDINDELLHLFGWGDGGGGPTREMLESARVLKNLPGFPRVKIDAAEPFFGRLEDRLKDKPVPVWDGELYLEYHRGTYTSQAEIKRANRKAEVLYHNAEWLSALADVLNGEDRYPVDELREGWELILLNQFHDILPGSSIRQVYEDSRADYDHINQIGQAAAAQARQRVIENIRLDQDSVVVFNPLSWPRDELVALPWSPSLDPRTLLNPDGTTSPAQIVEEDGERQVLVEVQQVPSLGYRAYPLIVRQTGRLATENEISVSPTCLENRYYRIELNERGQITALFDKRHKRQVLEPGAAGNVLQAFEDKPMDFDAWDIDIYYQEKMRPVDQLIEATVEENGPLRGVLRLVWRFLDSQIVQRLTIYRSSPRIDFKTEANWQEKQILLKAAFPVAVRATRATYEIQFGNIERPTHWNTSWDAARFEVIGHKWADLSEGNYGVALLNDCKYGHDVKDNVLRLTLIKSARQPDAEADLGKHTFTYSLLPHTGGWREGAVMPEAYALNYPGEADLAPQNGSGDLPERFSFARLDSDHVVLETVKKAEEENAWIVRLYEAKQYRNPAVHLDFGKPIRKAAACNLMEEEERPVGFEGHRLTFSINPYQIRTFKVSF